MSRVQHLPKKLPSREIPFVFSCEGAVTGEDYSDDFTVLVPDVAMMGRVGIEFAKLNGGVASEMLDGGTYMLHNAVAWLRVCLVDPPAWFVEDGYGLYILDTNVSLKLFTEANGKVQEWKNKLRGQPKDAESDNGRETGKVPTQSSEATAG